MVHVSLILECGQTVSISYGYGKHLIDNNHGLALFFMQYMCFYDLYHNTPRQIQMPAMSTDVRNVVWRWEIA